MGDEAQGTRGALWRTIGVVLLAITSVGCTGDDSSQADALLVEEEPFYFAMRIDGGRVSVASPTSPPDPPAEAISAACGNYRDWLADVSLNPQLVILDVDSLIRSAELLDGPFQGLEVAFRAEEHRTRGLEPDAIRRELEDAGFTDPDLERAEDYLELVAEPSSSRTERSSRCLKRCAGGSHPHVADPSVRGSASPSVPERPLDWPATRRREVSARSSGNHSVSRELAPGLNRANEVQSALQPRNADLASAAICPTHAESAPMGDTNLGYRVPAGKARLLLVITFSVGVVVAIATRGDALTVAVSAVLALVPVVITHLVAVRPSLTFGPGGVRVVNPLSTRELDISEIVRASGGQILRLHLRDGDAISVHAVQGAPASLLLNRPSRPDRIAAEVNRLLGVQPA